MTAVEFEARIVNWAEERRDIDALILAGSRAGPPGAADDRSDWDFHVVSARPQAFHGTAWLAAIAPCWAAHAGITARGVMKVTAVFVGGWEADFIPLATWQMKLVYASMRRPGWAPLMPGRLRRGILETRAFLLGSGFRVLKGGPKWTGRLEALSTPWAEAVLAPEQFAKHVASFWPLAVWLAKRVARAELRAAVLWHAKLMTEQVYPLLAEEARLAGKKPRPEARKAEQWLGPERLAQTRIAPGLTAPEQARALLATIDLFQSTASSVAAQRGFPLAPHGELEQWLRRELARLA